MANLREPATARTRTTTESEGRGRPRGRGRRPAGSADVSRERILEAAVTEFAIHGYEGATTAAVARTSGVTQPLVHYYFGTKEGLWRAALELLGKRLGMVLDGADEDAAQLPPEEALRLYIRRYIYFSAANPELSRMVAREAVEATPRLTWLMEKFLRTFSRQFDYMLEQARGAGALKDFRSEHVFFAVIGAVSFMFDGAALTRGLYGIDPFADDEIQGYADTVTEIFLRGLLK